MLRRVRQLTEVVALRWRAYEVALVGVDGVDGVVCEGWMMRGDDVVGSVGQVHVFWVMLFGIVAARWCVRILTS